MSYCGSDFHLAIYRGPFSNTPLENSKNFLINRKIKKKISHSTPKHQLQQPWESLGRKL